jgi:hypothetical protein
MLKKIVIGLVVFILLLVIIGLFLPSEIVVERSVEMTASSTEIHPQINTLENWKAWSPWEQEDDSIKSTYSGPESGVGATTSWTSEKSGDGTMKITKSDPETGVWYDISFDGGETWSKGSFEYEKTETGTKLSWNWSHDFGANILFRYMVLTMQGMMEDTWDKGLTGIKEIVEKEAGSGEEKSS